jgi:hypothetical protein
MAVGLRVEGLNELRRDLRRIKNQGLNQSMKDANKEIADEVIRRALPNVPVRTGRLKASVRGLGSLSGAVGKAGNVRVPYAAVIHWGRRRGGQVAARPFLKDAADSIEPDVADRYLLHVDRIFDAVRTRWNR